MKVTIKLILYDIFFLIGLELSNEKSTNTRNPKEKMKVKHGIFIYQYYLVKVNKVQEKHF